MSVVGAAIARPARVVRGDVEFANEVTAAIRAAMLGKQWCAQLADEVRGMRLKLESTASTRSLKRGPGGIVDVEFAVQLLQLKYGQQHPDILQSNVWDSLDALESAGLISTVDATALRTGYSFLRLVEARLRIVTDRPLTEVPESDNDREKLARRLGFDSPEQFLVELAQIRDDLRSRYDAITTRERK